MNWTKAILAGVIGGIVVTLADYVMHGFIMAPAYMKYDIFNVPEASPLSFFMVGIFVTVPAAIIFAKTRSSWASGIIGGVTFGFWIGLFLFFTHFYNPLTLNGFPYHFAWCWGGITMIDFLIAGAVIGAIYKK